VKEHYGLRSEAAARKLYAAMEAASHILTERAAAVDPTYSFLNAMDGADLIGRFSASTLHDNPGDFRLAGPYRYPMQTIPGTPYRPIMDFCEQPEEPGVSPSDVANGQAERARAIRAGLAAAGREAREREKLAALREYAELNAEIGRYDAAVFRSSTWLYQLLFARTVGEMRRGLRRSIAVRERALSLGNRIWHRALRIPIPVPDLSQATRLAGRFPAIRKELVDAGELLRWLERRSEFRFAAFHAYGRSLRSFWTAGRHVRWGMHLSDASVRNAVLLVDRAIVAAREALEMETRNARIQGNIRQWIDFVAQERRRLDVPSIDVPLDGGESARLGLQNDNPVRNAVSFMEHLTGYFGEMPRLCRRAPYWPEFTLRWTPAMLTIRIRGLPRPSRVGDPLAVFIDPGLTGRRFYRLLILHDRRQEPMQRVEVVEPFGLRVDEGLPGGYELKAVDDALEIVVAMSQFERAPEPGKTWGFNLYFNVYTPQAQAADWTLMGDLPGAWSPMFSLTYPHGDPGRFGRVRFV
jgi:hypothetical protein